MNAIHLEGAENSFEFNDRRADIIGQIFNITKDEILAYHSFVKSGFLPISTTRFNQGVFDFAPYKNSFSDTYLRDFAVAAAINYELDSQKNIILLGTPLPVASDDNNILDLPIQENISVDYSANENMETIARNCLHILQIKYPSESKSLPAKKTYDSLVQLIDENREYYLTNQSISQEKALFARSAYTPN